MSKRNVYKGHRYVPKIMGEWNQEETYEGLSIVTNKGTSYTSKKRVPVGIDILDEEYWVVTGNYNAQVENYRQEVREFDNRIRDNTLDIEKKADKSELDKIAILVKPVYDDTKNLKQTLDLLLDDNVTLFFEKSDYYIDEHILIKDFDNLSFVFETGARLIDNCGNLLRVVEVSDLQESPYGIRFENINNLTIDNLQIYNVDNLNAYAIILEDSLKRVPNIDFYQCTNIKLNNSYFQGNIGPHVTIVASPETEMVEIMRAGLVRMMKCVGIEIIDNTFKAGGGEFIQLFKCEDITIDNPMHNQGGALLTFWSLLKIIQCDNVTCKNFNKISSNSTGNMIDFSGHNYVFENFKCDYPNGSYFDLTLEWDVYSGDTSNVLLKNITQEGFAVLNTVDSFWLPDAENIAIKEMFDLDDVTIENVRLKNAGYFMECKQVKTIKMNNIKLKNVERLNNLFLHPTADIPFESTLNVDNMTVELTDKNFWVETVHLTNIKNSVFNGGGKSIILADRLSDYHKSNLDESNALIIFDNTHFEDLTISISSNVKFNNCTFKNVFFTGDTIYGDHPEIEFNRGSKIEYDNNTKLRAIFDFNQMSKVKIKLHNTEMYGEWNNPYGYAVFSKVNGFEISMDELKTNLIRVGHSNLNRTIFMIVSNNDKLVLTIKNSEINNNIMSINAKGNSNEGDIVLFVDNTLFPIKDLTEASLSGLYAVNETNDVNGFSNVKGMVKNSMIETVYFEVFIDRINQGGGNVISANNVDDIFS